MAGAWLAGQGANNVCVEVLCRAVVVLLIDSVHGNDILRDYFDEQQASNNVNGIRVIAIRNILQYRMLALSLLLVCL